MIELLKNGGNLDFAAGKNYGEEKGCKAMISPESHSRMIPAVHNPTVMNAKIMSFSLSVSVNRNLILPLNCHQYTDNTS